MIEQFARNGVGKLIIIDPDVIKDRNLNRILNAFEHDAVAKRLKVHVLKQAVEAMGTGTVSTR